MEDVHWLVPTLAATSCWALSDVCCDYAIAGGDDDDAPPPPDDKERRSPQMSTREADKGDEWPAVLSRPASGGDWLGCLGRAAPLG